MPENFIVSLYGGKSFPMLTPHCRFSAALARSSPFGAWLSRKTWWPARLEIADGKAIAHPLKWRSSGDMTGITAADLLLRIPGQSTGIASGGIVEAIRV